MPVYEWTGDGAFRHDGREVARGETVECSEHVGEPQPELVRVDEEAESGPSADASDDATDGSDEADADDEADSGGEDDAESEEADAFDAGAVREEHWQTVVNAIEAGEYDGHLDELAAADDRNSVQEAIDNRQA